MALVEQHTSLLYSPTAHPIIYRARVCSRAACQRHCVGGGAPVNFGRRRRATGPKKSAAARRGRPKRFFLRFTKTFCSILKIFLGIFLIIKALRFADNQC